MTIKSMESESMKVAVTGHTKGLGASLKNIFEASGHIVTGFSKSTGYNISDSESRRFILDSVHDADVFINNAYHKTGQLDLLKELAVLWEGQDKYIINISSKIVNIESEYFPENVKEYRDAKINMKQFTDDYKGSIRIYSILPDLLKTDFELSSIYFNPHKDGIATDEVSKLVYDMFKYRDSLHVSEVEILVPGKARGEI
jgi:hypothetical protein